MKNEIIWLYEGRIYRKNFTSSPKAPCLKSLKSALILVSFVHIFSKTYSVKCDSGAMVIGDFSSQCSSSSLVLYIPWLRRKKWIKSNNNPQGKIYLQLSRVVWHFCSSNGNFCRFIKQCSVACIRCDMMTVPSGETEVSTSFSDVPKIDDDLSLAKKMCGVHSESRKLLSPIIAFVRWGATVPNTKRGSTKRSWSNAWILNCFSNKKDKSLI